MANKRRSIYEADDVNHPRQQYLLDFMKMFVDVTSGIQHDYFQQKYNNARIIECVSINDVFTKDEVKQIKGIHPRKNQCYCNASQLTKLFPERVKYCEGYLGVCGMGIDHAFNLVDDKYYVDITSELVLKDNVADKDYAVYGTYTIKEMVDCEIKNMFYGDVFNTIYRQEHKH